MEVALFPTRKMERILDVFSLAAFVAVPPLAALACRSWVRVQRKALPRWRYTLGLTSILLVMLNWTVFLTLGLFMRARIHVPCSSIGYDSMLGLSSELSAGLCFSLKGAPKFRVLLASVLMAVLWAISVVE